MLLNRLNEAFKELLKINNDTPVYPYARRILDCASKYYSLRTSTKESKRKYGVDSIEFKSMLTDTQDKKREMNRLINEFNENSALFVIT